MMGGGGLAVPGQQSGEQAFRNTIPQLESIVKNRSDALQRLLPEINQERTGARQLLKLSVSEIAADQRAFDTAVEKSNTKIVFPKSWPEAVFLYQLRYGDMDAYLLALQQRLKALR
jgi:hypothetical protein